MDRQRAHDAVVNPIFSAALVVILASSLLALAYGATRLSYGLKIGSDFLTKLVFAIATAMAVAGLVAIPMLVIGPAVSPWQLIAYFVSLFVLAVLASAALVPLLFERPRGC